MTRRNTPLTEDYQITTNLKTICVTLGIIASVMWGYFSIYRQVEDNTAKLKTVQAIQLTDHELLMDIRRAVAPKVAVTEPAMLTVKTGK